MHRAVPARQRGAELARVLPDALDMRVLVRERERDGGERRGGWVGEHAGGVCGGFGAEEGLAGGCG